MVRDLVFLTALAAVTGYRSDPFEPLGPLGVQVTIGDGLLNANFNFDTPRDDEPCDTDVHVGVDGVDAGPAHRVQMVGGGNLFGFDLGDPASRCMPSALAVPLASISGSPVVWIGTDEDRRELRIPFGGAERKLEAETGPILLDGNQWVQLGLEADGQAAGEEILGTGHPQYYVDGTSRAWENPDMDIEVVGPGAIQTRIEAGSEDDYDGNCDSVDGCGGHIEILGMSIAPDIDCTDFEGLCGVTIYADLTAKAQWVER